MLGQLLNRPTTNPSKMLDKLSHLREREGRLIKELEAVQSEIATYQAALSQFVNPTASAAHIQASAYPTQVVSTVAPTRNIQPTAMAPTATVHPTNVTAQATANRNNIAKASPINSPPPPRTSQQPANSIKVEGMVSVMQNRMQQPYTDTVNVVSVEDAGYLIEYGHYLGGDGTGRSRPTPEGYRVTVHKSASTGNTYRKVYVPALRITCHLEQPLPADFNQKRQVIKDWLAANQWLCGVNPQKKQFTIEDDVWGYDYSPYVTADGRESTYIMYIYIGCKSFEDCAPTPTLIA